MQRLRATMAVRLALSIGLLAWASFAFVEIRDGGEWPNTWAKELEQLRERAETRLSETGIAYHVPFEDRDEFESAWPYILELTDKGSTLTLLPYAPNDSKGAPLLPSVGLQCPPPDRYETVDGRSFPILATFPDYIRNAQGELPEYVEKDKESGKWVEVDRTKAQGIWTRARIDISVRVDGSIVDLNRIRLPYNLRIIDRRFEKNPG
ncbi:MAG: hypothetical protein WC655_19645 [Candidatus Hydrogenedentales bacterium]